MDRHLITPGWYAAARPNRAFAAMHQGSLLTHRGTVPTPNGQPLLWLDLSVDGERIVGIGNRDDRAWLYSSATRIWTDLGGAFGPGGVLFVRPDTQIDQSLLPNGKPVETLTVLDPATAVVVRHGPPPKGYRQLSDTGTLVYASQSRADNDRRIYEYTTRALITIGQGGASDPAAGDDPLIACLPDGSFRLLAKGRCRAIKYYYDQGQIAIAWVQEDQASAGTLWCTEAELRALPIYNRPGSIPIPPEPGMPSAKATIDSYETPILEGQPSRAVRKITQGMPAKLRWRWRDAHGWHTGAENKPGDDDHHFNRVNGNWDNVFPPGEGRFPIQLQCLDAAGHVVDESDPNKRVIVVNPKTEPPIPPEPPVPLPPGTTQALHVDRQIFRTADGQPWRYKGVTAFKLLDNFVRGEDIDGFLGAYAGYNVVRIFPYVQNSPGTAPGKGWPVEWEPPSPTDTRRFLAHLASKGWYAEICLLTDDNPARLTWAQGFVPAVGTVTNLLWEGGNEPTTHKNINTVALKSVLAASGCMYASGNYEDSHKWYGTYGTWHSKRTADFPRYSHDALEYYHGGGPHNLTEPACPVPWIGDEPGKLEDVGTSARDWRALYGGYALFGGGATFHSENGKYGRLPSQTEATLAKVALDALNQFPGDAAYGGYRRIVETNQPHDSRTYVIGNRAVRCQQNGTAFPEPGWTALDSVGVLFRK